MVATTSQAQPAEKTAYLKPPVVVSTVAGIMARHQAEAAATALPSETPAPTATPGATPAATPGATPQPSAAPTPQQASFVYTIQPGDSIGSIASSFGIGEDYILWNNPDASRDPNLLAIGEQLLIPSENGIVYHVALGDTLSDIATTYKIDTQSIVSFLPNKLPSADRVTEGMVLLLPGAVPPPPPPAPASPEPTPGETPPAYVAAEAAPAAAAPAAAAADAVPVPAPAPVASSGLIWPWHGAITQPFGPTHKGIDIDGYNQIGAPIVAAAGGTVVLAAYTDYGYGNYVIIDHGDGMQTLYAHLSAIWVAQGQSVSQGEAIGALGTSGYSTGPHLHFEVHIGGVPVDPLGYLP